MKKELFKELYRSGIPISRAAWMIKVGMVLYGMVWNNLGFFSLISNAIGDTALSSQYAELQSENQKATHTLGHSHSADYRYQE